MDMVLCRAIAVVFVSVIIVWFYHIIRALDFGKVVWKQRPGTCHLVPGVVNGSEDIQLLEDGTALISSGLRFKYEIPGVKGQILFFDFKQPKLGAVPVEIKGFDLSTFNPHGLSVWKNEKGGVRGGLITVFVVNHPLGSKGQDRVEIFTWNASKKTLTYIKSVTDDKFTNLNDLAATSENSFFVTHLHYFIHPILREAEAMLFRKWGHVLYYDGDRAHIMVDGLGLPNGLAFSQDKKTLYVALYMDKSLGIFERNRNDSLTLLKTLDLGSSPDNVFVDNTGAIWIGSQPLVWHLSGHLTSKSPMASQVLRVRFHDGYEFTVEQIFSDPGETLHGVSSAVFWQNALLIGTVQHKLMYCEVLY